MASVLDLSRLANAVYLTKDGKLAGPVSGWAPLKSHGDPDHGFYAVMFKRSRDDETVLAVRGTDPTQLSDLKSDAQLALGAVPTQFFSADGFLSEIRPQMGGRALYLTGHSLGGGLASLLSAKYRLPTVTFNAPGMKNSMCSLLSSAAPASGNAATARQRAENEINALDISRMLNIRAAADVVSRGTGPAIGRVEDIVVPPAAPNILLTAVAEVFHVGMLYGMGTVALNQHSMDNVVKAIELLPKYQTDLGWVAVPAAVATAAAPRGPSKVYTVAAGDTLAKIAQTYYNDPLRWKDIYAVPVNRTVIGTNPAMIRPGQRLQIPA